ncbi:MAG TPA: hypothetical protein VEL69_09690, partial [Ktedonobacteraceae bacterium]|nr:hypothetical protein [Ktedonobacteraceae bacterium]
MKTREIESEPVNPQEPARRKKATWLTGVGAVLVVLLLVGASAVVFAQLSAHRHGPGQSNSPPAGKWIPALSGYTVTSLLAAGNAPTVLYACADRVGTGNAAYTVLRSADAGTHWQDVGAKANLGSSCQLAVNTVDSNDIYATGEVASNGQMGAVLRHTLDGGATWTTIQPSLNLPKVQSAQLWNVQQLSSVGGRLFGVQSIARYSPPIVFQGTPPKYSLPLTRLVTSADGGHTWNVLDSQFTTIRQEALSYAVDPTNASTIYELVGLPWYSLQPGVLQPDGVVPLAGRNEDLYKTTDSGASWHVLLKGLPFGARVHVQLAPGDAQMIYAGGSITPVPYLAGAPAENPYSVGGPFHLQLSRDGGASWHAVPALPRQENIQNWFAGARGDVFAYSYNLNTGNSGSATAVASTAVAVTPVRA